MKPAQTIQDVVNGLSTILTYVCDLDRRVSFLQKSNEITTVRLSQVEKEYVQIIRSKVETSNLRLIHGSISGCWNLGAVRVLSSDRLYRN